MRTLAFLLCLALSQAAYGQLPAIYQPGFSGPVGPYVYTPYSPRPVYYNPSGYIPPAYGYGRGYRTWLDEERNYELRQLRYSIEDAAWQRSWRR